MAGVETLVVMNDVMPAVRLSGIAPDSTTVPPRVLKASVFAPVLVRALGVVAAVKSAALVAALPTVILKPFVFSVSGPVTRLMVADAPPATPVAVGSRVIPTAVLWISPPPALIVKLRLSEDAVANVETSVPLVAAPPSTILLTTAVAPRPPPFANEPATLSVPLVTVVVPV